MTASFFAGVLFVDSVLESGVRTQCQNPGVSFSTCLKRLLLFFQCPDLSQKHTILANLAGCVEKRIFQSESVSNFRKLEVFV